MIVQADALGLNKQRGTLVNEMGTDGQWRDANAKLWPQTERIKAWTQMALLPDASGPRSQALERATQAMEALALYLKHLLVDSIAKQFDAFCRGFRKVCDTEPFSFFRADELELLICGSPKLDFHELEQACKREGVDFAVRMEELHNLGCGTIVMQDVCEKALCSTGLVYGVHELPSCANPRAWFYFLQLRTLTPQL